MSEDRRDDWRNGVDQAIVNLTSAQRVTDQQLDDLELKYEALDHVMRGDPEKETDGFISRLHAAETWIQEQKIEKLKLKLGEKTNEGIKWQTLGTIIAAIITTGGLLLINLQRIKQAINPAEVRYQPSDKLKSEIQRDKERHHKRKAPSASGPSSILPSIIESSTSQK